MSKKRLTVAVIGAGGNMRGAHLPRIERDGFARIVGAADPVSEQIDRFTERAGYEVPAFSDWREMLAETDSDAVFISTPHSDHHAQIKACLDAGRHVLVEKPMVMTPGQARSTLRNAEQAKRLLMVAYQRHWMPEYVYAKELITKGALGEIRGVVGYVTQNWGALGGWRLDPEKAGGGMYMDTGSHLVASMLWMTGLRPTKVSATFDNARRPVDINAAVQIAFTGGAVGTLTTIGNASRHDERLMISGSEGCLVLHLHQWQVRSMLLNDEPVSVPKRIRPDTPDGALFRWIRTGGKGYEAPEFALQVARLTEASYRSAEEKAPVTVRR